MSCQFYEFSTNNILLRILEHMSYIKLLAKYSSHKYNYSNIIINKIIFNKPCSALYKYREFLLLYSGKEQLRRFYFNDELKVRLTKICNFYGKYTKIFPNYIILYERKYIYKNIRKKQKMIDAVNKMNYEKNMIKEYLKDNKCFDNEIFKGPLFTEEVEYEIAKDNMINNSNYDNNHNEDDTLFTQNSNSLFLKNDNINKYTNNIMNMNNKNNNNNIKNDISIESFITNNESNRSLFNIMDVLNDNKIYINDLRLLLNDNINHNNNNYIRLGNKSKQYEGIKQVLKEGNNNNENINDNNNEKKIINIDKSQSNKESSNKQEENINQNNNNAIQKDNKNQQIASTISGRIKKTKKMIKKNCNTNENNNNNSSNKEETIVKNKRRNNYYKKIMSPENNNINNKTKNSKDKMQMGNNLKEYYHLQTVSGTDINLLTKNRLFHRKTERKISKPKNKEKSKANEKKENNMIVKAKLSLGKFSALKKYIRFRHISQDFGTNYNISKDDLIRTHNSLINNLDKENQKIRTKIFNSKMNVGGISSIIKSNKKIADIQNIKKSQIINNQIIIENNNNYYFTENNNPNLITGNTKINYDINDCDNEREKLLIYFRDIAESQRLAQLQRLPNNQEKSKDNGFTLENIKTENYTTNRKGNIYINDSINRRRTRANFLQKFISKQKTEKKFKKDSKCYLNHLNNSCKISNISNYPIIKYNTIRKIHHKRNNSNFTVNKKINPINSSSKIKKYNSNCSIKAEDLISPNKDIFNAEKAINCYSYNDSKNISKNKNELISKNNDMIKEFNTNKGFLKVIDVISSDSSKNILSQRLRRNRIKDFTISLTKDESKNSRYNNNKILEFDKNSTKNLTISNFNKYNNDANKIRNQKYKNKIKTYNNKKQISDFSMKQSKFSSCDFDSMKNTYIYPSNFSKGLLDRINNIKKKINEGINIKKINRKNKLKKENTQIIYLNKINNNYNYYLGDKQINNYNEFKEKKNNNNINKSKKIYENKMINNDNKENIPTQNFIKVNKTKNFGNNNAHLHFSTEI